MVTTHAIVSSTNFRTGSRTNLAYKYGVAGSYRIVDYIEDRRLLDGARLISQEGDVYRFSDGRRETLRESTVKAGPQFYRPAKGPDPRVRLALFEGLVERLKSQLAA